MKRPDTNAYTPPSPPTQLTEQPFMTPKIRAAGFLTSCLISISSLTACDKFGHEAAEARYKKQEAAKQAEEAQKTAAYIDQLLVALRSTLKDPDSAKFRNVVLKRDGISTKSGGKLNALCGEYNAKNSYGGYPGFSKFIISEDAAGKVLVMTEEDPIGWVVGNLYYSQGVCG